MLETSLRAWQDRLHLGAQFSDHFVDNREVHKNFRHAHTQITRAAGHLATVIAAMDHGAIRMPPQHETGQDLADLVIWAMRLANTCPGGRIDLHAAVSARLAELRLLPSDFGLAPVPAADNVVVGPGIRRTFRAAPSAEPPAAA